MSLDDRVATRPTADFLPRGVRRELARLDRELVRSYRGKLPARIVHGYVADAVSQMSQVRLTRFIPALVADSVRRRIEQNAGAAEQDRRSTRRHIDITSSDEPCHDRIEVNRRV